MHRIYRPTHKAHRAIGVFALHSLLICTNAFCESNFSKGDISLFGKASSTSTLSWPNLVNIQLLNDKIIVQTKVDSKKKFSIVSLESLSEDWTIETPCMFYNVSEGDDAAIVLVDVVEEGVLNMTALSLERGVLFSKNSFSDGELFPSPNGKYFYTKRSQSSSNSLTVFDTLGIELLKLPAGDWDAAAFNDSILTYFIGDEIRFISIPSGSVISSIVIPQGPLFANKFPVTPATKISPNGGNMLVCWHGKKTLITDNLSIRWQHRYVPAFLNAAFSPNAKFLAIYEGKGKDCLLTFISTVDGRILWTEAIFSSKSEGTSRHRDISVTSRVVRIFVPQAYYLAAGILDTSTSSILFGFDPRSGELIKKEQTSGVIFIYDNSSRLMTVSVSDDDPERVHFKNWEEDDKTK